MHAFNRPHIFKILHAPPLDPDAADVGPESDDDDYSLDLDDEYWEALLLDDDYEPLPEKGDFPAEPAESDAA